MSGNLERKYLYELLMNNGEKVQIEIKAQSEIARDTFLKKFLEDSNEKYFLDESSNKRYNKAYIYSCELKGESNG